MTYPRVAMTNQFKHYPLDNLGWTTGVSPSYTGTVLGEDGNGFVRINRIYYKAVKVVRICCIC